MPRLKCVNPLYTSGSLHLFDPVADPEGVRLDPHPFETKLFHFHGEFTEKSGQNNK